MSTRMEVNSKWFRSGTTTSEGVNPDDVDALLASELNNMTFDERENMYEEIHGVEKDFEETDEFLEQCLVNLERALQTVSDRPIYEKAWNESRQYVEDRSFRLMFLRAEYYNEEKAAIRLVKFLKAKTQLFGPQTLTRRITLADFSPEDMDYLKMGIQQLIPARDRKGRAITCDFNMDPDFKLSDVNSMIKSIVYLFCAVAEDVETQKKGVVGVFYFTAALKAVQDLHKCDVDMFSWLPIRVVSVHFCYSDLRFRLVKALCMLIIGRKQRVRVRMHEGSHTECQYKLLTYGVPMNVFPVTYDGEIKPNNHLKWLARRYTMEDELRRTGRFSGIDLPAPKDVLLGRGKTVQDHTGNIILRNRVASYMDEYKNAVKIEKRQVALKVLLDTKRDGGRFLKRESNGWWMEVSDEAAREKISMAFRTTLSTCVSPNMAQLPRERQVNDSKKARLNNDPTRMSSPVSNSSSNSSAG